MTKLLPGWFGFRPTRGLVNRGWKIPKLRSSTGTLLAKLSVILSRVRWTTSKTWCCTIPVWLLIATTMSRLVSFAISHKSIDGHHGIGGKNYNLEINFGAPKLLPPVVRGRLPTGLVSRGGTADEAIEIVGEHRRSGQLLPPRLQLSPHDAELCKHGVPFRLEPAHVIGREIAHGAD